MSELLSLGLLMHNFYNFIYCWPLYVIPSPDVLAVCGVADGHHILISKALRSINHLLLPSTMESIV